LRVEHWLSDNDLKLTRKPNFGLLVEEGEVNLRDGIFHWIKECSNEIQMMAAFGGNAVHFVPEIEVESGRWKILRTILLELNLRKCLQIIHNSIGLDLSDWSQLNLVLQVAIMSWRIKLGFKIPKEADSAMEKPPIEKLHAAQLIAANLSQKFDIRISKADLGYLVSLLERTDIQWSKETITNKVKQYELIDIEFNKLVNEFLEKVSMYLNPSLLIDQELKTNLTSHFSHIIRQTKMGLITPNPFLSDIKRDYPLVYRCAWLSIQDSYYLKELLNEDEVGYLTLYIVLALNRLYSPISKQIRVFIVCNSGKATALLLESRIKTEFPDVVVVGITSYLELLNRQYQNECDLVISTIPIQLRNVPAITVSPFLSTDDLAQLKTILSPGNNKDTINRGELFPISGKLQLSNLLCRQTVHLKENAFTWQEVVEKAGSILLSIGAITFTYIQAIQATIDLHGPYMVIWPGIALLHAIPGKGVLKPCMSLMTLKKPVAFGHGFNDPVDIAIVLGPVDNQIHVPALISLVDMMKEQKAVQALRSATRIDDALKVISKYSYDQKDSLAGK